MQYMFEKEYVFYDEYCKPAENMDEYCDEQCSGTSNATCIDDCLQPFICEAALTQYNFIFTLFRNIY